MHTINDVSFGVNVSGGDMGLVGEQVECSVCGVAIPTGAPIAILSHKDPVILYACERCGAQKAGAKFHGLALVTS
jgi:hypothetical protein